MCLYLIEKDRMAEMVYVLYIYSLYKLNTNNKIIPLVLKNIILLWCITHKNKNIINIKIYYNIFKLICASIIPKYLKKECIIFYR